MVYICVICKVVVPYYVLFAGYYFVSCSLQDTNLLWCNYLDEVWYFESWTIANSLISCKVIVERHRYCGTLWSKFFISANYSFSLIQIGIVSTKQVVLTHVGVSIYWPLCALCVSVSCVYVISNQGNSKISRHATRSHTAENLCPI